MRLFEISNNSKPEIYVDMDGVLVDFFGAWAKLMGAKDFRDIKDIDAGLQAIRDADNFWLDLEPTPNAGKLLALIQKHKGSYTILSSPLADDPRSEPHKRMWVKNNLKQFPPKSVIITGNKAKYAQQSDGTPNILIDDFGQNIDKWNAAGGIGVKHKDHKFERSFKTILLHLDNNKVKENFADGKKKGKSRPGRVKKSGASCNGSVTSLRAKAKKASGEKAKMYHWCANMKSGRKKK
jgi:5'(3')-deoxyribonucleotidase|tara:strand:- start:1451 stop:2161 length:711 start_codon:yes stop_codon:yes gene_type:complete